MVCVPVTVIAVASTNAPAALKVFDSSCVASGRKILIAPLKLGPVIDSAIRSPAAAAARRA